MSFSEIRVNLLCFTESYIEQVSIVEYQEADVYEAGTCGINEKENDEKENENDDKENECEDMIFVQILHKFGKPLLQKSQAPLSKIKKKAAIEQVVNCLKERGFSYNEQKTKKKVENMKTRLKKKIDRKKTGNVPIVLKKHEKLLMEILDGTDNPSISRVKCNVICYAFPS